MTMITKRLISEHSGLLHTKYYNYFVFYIYNYIIVIMVIKIIIKIFLNNYVCLLFCWKCLIFN